jgi:hypothetical protein
VPPDAKLGSFKPDWRCTKYVLGVNFIGFKFIIHLFYLFFILQDVPHTNVNTTIKPLQITQYYITHIQHR